MSADWEEITVEDVKNYNQENEISHSNDVVLTKCLVTKDMFLNEPLLFDDDDRLELANNYLFEDNLENSTNFIIGRFKTTLKRDNELKKYNYNWLKSKKKIIFNNFSKRLNSIAFSEVNKKKKTICKEGNAGCYFDRNNTEVLKYSSIDTTGDDEYFNISYRKQIHENQNRSYYNENNYQNLHNNTENENKRQKFSKQSNYSTGYYCEVEFDEVFSNCNEEGFYELFKEKFILSFSVFV
ncbi:hypothetical protein HK099_007139 [Clydaea vesicula]|uniref:Uncharacterized protein n=1 Tax=Clydaea vesicula TaxID=447962 RepID=A0AAD5U9L1_9FUNG|nr:hypothetical protein HK099_007139 [Clydaea vesicula]KAJ3394235.1 hypothetical protein HDU92_007094 [Lobulomyces angularis]